MRSSRYIVSVILTIAMLVSMLVPMTVGAEEVDDTVADSTIAEPYIYSSFEEVVQRYIVMLQYTNREIDDQLFTNTPSAQEAVAFTYWSMGYELKKTYYDENAKQFIIPYDDMVEYIGKYFANVPSKTDLQSVNFGEFGNTGRYLISIKYDESTNSFIQETTDGGDANQYITVEQVSYAGDQLKNIYFKVSNDTADDVADAGYTKETVFQDASQYSRYVMTVSYTGASDNIEIVSFQKDEEAIDISEENFPDAALRTQLSEDYDVDKDGQISTAESLWKFEANSDVASIEGLEVFEWLITLDISNSAVINVDLSLFPQLWSFECANTGLTELDFSANSELEHVLAYNTKVSTFDFSGTAIDDDVRLAGAEVEEVILAEDSTLQIDDKFLIGDSDSDKVLYASWYTRDDVDVEVPSTVTYITYGGVFAGDNTPSKIEIPDSVSIGYGAFVDCDNLQTLVFGDDVYFSADIFKDCDNISDFYFTGTTPESWEVKGESYWGVVSEGTWGGYTLNVYYPEDDADWATFITKDYDGDITWIPWDPTEEVPTPSNIGDPTTDDTSDVVVNVEVTPTVTDTTAKATVSDDVILAELAEVPAGTSATVNVVVDTNTSVEKVEVTLSADVIGTLASSNAESVSIKSGLAELVLDQATLAAIAEQTDSAVTLVVDSVDASTLTDEAQALVGDRPVFEFTIVDENGNEVTDFDGGKIKVTVPYTLQEGEVAANLVVYYIANDGTLEEIKGVTYNAEDETISFEVSHFSTYAIAYVEAEAGSTVTSDDVPETGDATNTILFMCFGIISLLGMGRVVNRKKSI